MNPARSYSPSAYMPGISAVSPPMSAQPLFLQPRAMPDTTLAANSAFELAHREIVEEEKRPGALDGDVVYAVVYQIFANGVVTAGSKGDFQFGADAIGRADQYRIAPALERNSRRRNCRWRSVPPGSVSSQACLLIKRNSPVGLVDVDTGITIANLLCQQISVTNAAPAAAHWRTASTSASASSLTSFAGQGHGC